MDTVGGSGEARGGVGVAFSLGKSTEEKGAPRMPGGKKPMGGRGHGGAGTQGRGLGGRRRNGMASAEKNSSSTTTTTETDDNQKELEQAAQAFREKVSTSITPLLFSPLLPQQGF